MKREFAFEMSINNSLSCLPMSVKRKLDRVALKIGRDQWLGMTAEERKAISNLPAETEQERETLILFIRKMLADHGTVPRLLPEMAARLSEPPLKCRPKWLRAQEKWAFCLIRANGRHWTRNSAMR
jgi:Conserved nitrate reductase-associated protein (Nitr_red_assoc)